VGERERVPLSPILAKGGASLKVPGDYHMSLAEQYVYKKNNRNQAN
jgi:hypothetical protein